MANNSPVLALLARILMALSGASPALTSQEGKPAFRGAKDRVDLRGRGAAALKASLLESLEPMLAKSEIRAIN
jgi:hypothetical protein